MMGHGKVGGRIFPNLWVPPGRLIQVVYCDLCRDTGMRRVDRKPCLCTKSWARWHED